MGSTSQIGNLSLSAKSAESRLQYYASQFRIVEVDSSYYALLNEKTSRLWVERTGEDFVFDVKAFRLFTQHPTPLSSLPKDIRNELSQSLKEKSNIYQKDLPGEVVNEVWNRFEQALLPLDSAGKLGTVLFQFPPWFYPGNEQRNYILSCKERVPQYHMAVEFRHNSWVNEKNHQRTMDFLRQNELPFVCVDEPQGFKSSVPPIAEATSDISLIRFHGRNREMWEKKGIGPAERFNYLYNEDELRKWIPRIKELAANTKQLHVLFNNCYADKAVVNARQIGYMLG
jgi:uncharacterized protein YecE (DUF72 family)